MSLDIRTVSHLGLCHGTHHALHREVQINIYGENSEFLKLSHILPVILQSLKLLHCWFMCSCNKVSITSNSLVDEPGK
jgi:hypothetical protein